MGEFYKLLFQPFQKQWIEEKKAVDMDLIVAQFTKQYFSKISQKIGQKDQLKLKSYLTVLVHSHRHNKNEEFLNDENLDFGTIRDVMYKYSKKAQQTFFEQKLLSFLFCWFAMNPESSTFIQRKYEAKGKEYVNKILDEIN